MSMKLSSPEKSVRQLVHHALFLFLTTPKLKKFLKIFILQINTTRADFVSQGMNHAEGMMTKCFAKGNLIKVHDDRVRKSENFLDSKIVVAKTFQIKRVNRVNFRICDKCA